MSVRVRSTDIAVTPTSVRAWQPDICVLSFDVGARVVNRRRRNSDVGLMVSLSADPVEEIHAGFDILKSLGLRHRGVNVISCPSCARQQFDVIKTVEVLEQRLAHITTPMTVSVIGCVVNGPGEAREADIGVTGGYPNTVFENGQISGKLKNDDLVIGLDELVRREIGRRRSCGDHS